MGAKESHSRRASHFSVTRGQHSNEAAEDYTELIYELIETRGQARVGEVAQQLGISHVTALRTIKRLKQQGYILGVERAPLQLSEKGEKLALFAKRRHRLLVEFFVKIGVPLKTAERDVEGVEHHISAISLGKIEEFLRRESGPRE